MKHGILWVAEHVARMEKGKSPFKILTGKRPLGWPSRRWEDNVTSMMDSQLLIMKGNYYYKI